MSMKTKAAVAASAKRSGYATGLDFGLAGVKAVDPTGHNVVGGVVDGARTYFSSDYRAVINTRKSGDLAAFRSKIGIS
jgi:hypothetical protein